MANAKLCSRRCKKEAAFFCTGCCRTWPQSSTVEYHRHLTACECGAVVCTILGAVYFSLIR